MRRVALMISAGVPPAADCRDSVLTAGTPGDRFCDACLRAAARRLLLVFVNLSLPWPAPRPADTTQKVSVAIQAPMAKFR